MKNKNNKTSLPSIPLFPSLMAAFSHSCNPLFMSFIIFVSIFTFQSSHSSPLHHQRHLLQADSPQNIETVFPTGPFPASPPNSPPSNPPTTKPAISPTPNTAPAQTPPASQNSTGRKAVAKAVVATAASTLVIAGLFFFLLHRFGLSRRWRRNKGDKASFASNPYRNEETAVSGDAFKLVNGALKGLIVDENGLDVLYWRKLENGSLKNGMYKEVLNGRNKEKRHGHGGVRHSNSDPIPKIRSFSTNSSDSSVEISLSRSVFSPPRNRTSASGVAPVAQLPPPSPTPIVVHENPAPPKPPPPPPSVVNSEKPAPAPSASGVAPVAQLPPPSPTPVVVHENPAPPKPPPPSPSVVISEKPAPAPPPSPQPPTPTKKNPTLPPPPPMPTKKNPVPPPPPSQASSAKPPPPPPSVVISEKPAPAPPPPPPPPTPTKKNPTLPPPPPMPAKKNSVPLPPPPQASSAKPPPALPFGSKGKLSSSSSREVSGISEGEKSRKGGVQAKLKPLHWDKVVANAEHSMVWEKIGSGSFRFDDELMEALFGYVASNRKSSDPTNNSGQQSSTSSSNSTAKAPRHLLDPRKSQNIAIVLRSLAVTRQEILDALLNGQALSADTLEKLTKIAPTQEEEAMILEFSGDPSKLGDAESFLYHLLQAVPSPFRRLDLMLFRTTYDAEILHLKESLQALELACKELRTRGLFLKLLEAVLKAGNRMNAGTARGNAQAFNLTALRKLSDVKSTDGKTTLLHFVVEEVVRSEGKRLVINRNHSLSRSNSNSNPSTSMATEDREKEYIMLGLPVVGGLTVEFANVKKAAAIDYENFIKAGSALSARLSDIRQFLASQDANGKGDGYVKEMKGFAEVAEEELKVVKGEEGRVMELVARTTDYYQAGASRGKGAHPFQLFVIVKDFLSMVDQVCINISRNRQQKKKPAVGSSSLAPPQSSSPRVAVRFPILPPHFMSNSSTSSSDSEDEF